MNKSDVLAGCSFTANYLIISVQRGSRVQLLTLLNFHICISTDLFYLVPDMSMLSLVKCTLSFSVGRIR